MGTEPIADNGNTTSDIAVIVLNDAAPINGDKHIHEKAYYRGYRDFLHGRLDTPYRRDSLLSKEWQRGQNAAYFVNLRKLKDGSLLRQHYKKKNANKAKKPVGVK